MYIQVFLAYMKSLNFCMHISVTLEFSNVYLPSPQLLSHLVKLYLSFLAIRNIPILEAMYRYACMSINVYMAALQSSAQVYLVYVTQLLPLEIFLPEERFCQFCHLLSLAKFYPWIFLLCIEFHRRLGNLYCTGECYCRNVASYPGSQIRLYACSVEKIGEPGNEASHNACMSSQTFLLYSNYVIHTMYLYIA